MFNIFKWFKTKRQCRKELKLFKQHLAQENMTKLHDAIAVAKACKHAERIKIAIDNHWDEVTCLHCGLIKILAKRADKL